MEGYLSRKTDALINPYHKYYCKFLNSGRVLGFAEKMEDFGKGMISAQVSLDLILKIDDMKDTKEGIHLLVEGGGIKLKAENIEQKEQWKKAINQCQLYSTKSEKYEKKVILEIDPDIKFEEIGEEDDDQVMNSKRNTTLFAPINFIVDTAKKVVIDHGLGTATKIIRTGFNTVGKIIASQKDSTNEEFFQAKGLSTYFSMIDPKILKSRVVAGYLNRELREALGNKVLDKVANDSGMRNPIGRVWALLISSRPLVILFNILKIIVTSTC